MQVIRWAIAAIMLFPVVVQAIEPDVHVIINPANPAATPQVVIPMPFGTEPIPTQPIPTTQPVPAPIPAPEVATTLQKLQVVFPLNSIVDWVQAKGKLRTVPAVKDFRELEVTTSYAKLELSYTGDIPALAADLQKAGLSLMQQDNDWILK